MAVNDALESDTSSDYIDNIVYEHISEMSAEQDVKSADDAPGPTSVDRMLRENVNFKDFSNVVPPDAASIALSGGNYIDILNDNSDDMPDNLKDIVSALNDEDVTPGEARVLLSDFLGESARSGYENKRLLAEIVSIVISTGIVSSKLSSEDKSDKEGKPKAGSQGIAKIKIEEEKVSSSNLNYISPLDNAKKIKSYGWRYDPEISSSKMNTSMRLSAANVQDVFAVMDGAIIDVGEDNENGKYIKFVDINNYCHLFFNLGSTSRAEEILSNNSIVSHGQPIAMSGSPDVSGNSYLDWQVVACSDDQDLEHISFSKNIINPERLYSFSDRKEKSVAGDALGVEDLKQDMLPLCDVNEIELVAFKLALKNINSSRYLLDLKFDNLLKISNEFSLVGQYKILQETWEGRATSDVIIDGVDYKDGTLLPEDESWSYKVFGDRDMIRDIINDEKVADTMVRELYSDFCNWRSVAIAWYAGDNVIGTPIENSNEKIIYKGSEVEFDSVSGYANRVMALYRKNRENIVGRIDYSSFDNDIEKVASNLLRCTNSTTLSVPENEIEAFKSSIKEIESTFSTNTDAYGERNPDASSGAALGAYQIMDFNWYGRAPRRGYYYNPDLSPEACDSLQLGYSYRSRSAIPSEKIGCFEEKRRGELLHHIHSWAWRYSGNRYLDWREPDNQERIGHAAIKYLFCKHYHNYINNEDSNNEELWAAIAISWYAGEGNIRNSGSRKRIVYGPLVDARGAPYPTCNLYQNDTDASDFCRWLRSDGTIRNSYTSINGYVDKFLRIYRAEIASIGGAESAPEAETELPSSSSTQTVDIDQIPCFDSDGNEISCHRTNDILDMHIISRRESLEGLFSFAARLTDFTRPGEGNFDDRLIGTSRYSGGDYSLIPRVIGYLESKDGGVSVSGITPSKPPSGKSGWLEYFLFDVFKTEWGRYDYWKLQKGELAANMADVKLVFYMSHEVWTPGCANASTRCFDRVVAYVAKKDPGDDADTYKWSSIIYDSGNQAIGTLYYATYYEMLGSNDNPSRDQIATAVAASEEAVKTAVEQIAAELMPEVMTYLYTYNGNSGEYYNARLSTISN